MRKPIIALILFYPLISVAIQGYCNPADTVELDRQLEETATTANGDSALSKYRALYDRSVSAGYPRGQVRSLNAMSVRYFNKGMHDSMIACLGRAVALALPEPGLRRQLPSLYNNLGIAWQSAGNYDSSLSAYYGAIDAQQRHGSSISRGTPYLNLGMLMRRLSRYEKALAATRTALAIFRREGEAANLPATYLNLGGIYSVMNIPGKEALAARYLGYALSRARGLGQRQVEQKALYELGLLAGNKGLTGDAISYYEAALRIPTGNPYDDLVPVINLGASYAREGRYEEALPILEGGLAKALQSLPAPDFTCDFYLQLATVYEHLGRYSAAFDYYRRYIALDDSLRGRGLQGRINRLESRYAAGKQENELMRQQLVIAAQAALLQRNRVTGYGVATAAAVLVVVLSLLYRNRRAALVRAVERQKWEASRAAEEKERGRIARDLHDHVAGSLVTARQWFASIPVGALQNGQQGEYLEAMHLLDNSIAEIRHTAHFLVPGLVVTHGLAAAVEAYCQSVGRAVPMQVDYQYLGHLGRLDGKVELALFRCVQELVQNVIKHAEASRVLVQLSCHANGMLSITVEDNGTGITPGNRAGGIGLTGIRQSVTSLGGTFGIHSGKYSATSALIEMDVSPYLEKP